MRDHRPGDGLGDAHRRLSHLARPSNLAILAFAAIAALVIWQYSSIDVFGNDAAQYISVSDTFAATGRLATTTLYYELHHNLGMPAAQTVWPPGYPLLIGSLERLTGADSVELIRVVNAFAHLFSVILLYATLLRLCERRAIAAFLAACYALHAYSLYLAATGLSEPLYTLLGLAVAFGLVRTFESGIRPGWLLVAGSAAALACLVRYQALVCAVALGLAVLCVCLNRRLGTRRALAWAALSVAPFLVTFALIVARNLAIANSVTGGPQVPGGGQPLLPLLVELARDVMQLMPGALKPVSLALRLLLLGALGWLVVLSLRIILTSGWSREPRGDTRLALTIYGGAFAAGTVALIVLLALGTSAYTIELRYLMPTVPALIVGFAALLTEGDRRFVTPGGRVLGGALALGLVGVTAVNLLGWHENLETREHDSLRHVLAVETRDGVTMQNLLARAAANGGPVMSNQSQQLHLALREPTLGVPERRLSARQWRDADLQRLARRFDVHYIILFKKRPLGGGDGRNDYVLPLAQQQPKWTRTVFSTPEVELLEIAR